MERGGTTRAFCDRPSLLEARERALEIAFEQFDPAEIGQRFAGSAGVVDEPGELERLVQPARVADAASESRQ